MPTEMIWPTGIAMSLILSADLPTTPFAAAGDLMQRAKREAAGVMSGSEHQDVALA